MSNSSSFNRVLDPDVSRYGLKSPLAWKAACLAARLLPRGGGVAARAIGLHFLMHSKPFAVTVPGGSVLAVDPANLTYFVLLAEGRARGQVETVRRCLSLLTPESVFYDVGANAGYISVEAARRAKFVAAFEPQPTLAAAAAATVRLNEKENVHVFQAALGKETGELSLYVPRFGIHASAVAREAGAKCLRCPVYKIDDIVASKAIPPPNVMKVDVEGAELDVFKGAAETLAKYRPALFFEADENLRRFGLTRTDLLDYLRSLAPYTFRAWVGEHYVPLDAPGAETSADILATVDAGPATAR